MAHIQRKEVDEESFNIFSKELEDDTLTSNYNEYIKLNNIYIEIKNDNFFTIRLLNYSIDQETIDLLPSNLFFSNDQESNDKVTIIEYLINKNLSINDRIKDVKKILKNILLVLKNINMITIHYGIRCYINYTCTEYKGSIKDIINDLNKE